MQILATYCKSSATQNERVDLPHYPVCNLIYQFIRGLLEKRKTVVVEKQQLAKVG